MFCVRGNVWRDKLMRFNLEVLSSYMYVSINAHENCLYGKYVYMFAKTWDSSRERLGFRIAMVSSHYKQNLQACTSQRCLLVYERLSELHANVYFQCQHFCILIELAIHGYNGC